MLIITGTFRLPPANLHAARQAMAAMVAASRVEAGCLHYSYGEDVFDPGLIHVTEHWADHATLAAHGTSPHIRAWRAAWPGLGIGDRDLTLFEADGGRPA
ncbi:MAG: antibiotic biosynthesis monooxygenase [Sphingomonas sp.]|uniref:putative quinol monooxygenase n=1 Tax=unclassified Sphingomonas TaxID=196159 RepID=UPI002458268D|nr:MULTISPECIES: putative quinol monooxygenase [unclassified Sphingomonas]MBQ1498328.1 antibiotic biosynthesis monooxygenase [Sphingomonas sp.]MDH4742906.1 antibiotic biosynthesis monooxygenase [Sphingomonas sp. CBMAI 2297]